MNFLGMGPGELMVIMILALIVFGPGKLPEIGQGLGKAIREFRRATSQITDEFTREIQLDAPLQQSRPAAPPPPPQEAHVEAVPGTAEPEAEAAPLVLEIKRPRAASAGGTAVEVSETGQPVATMAEVSAVTDAPAVTETPIRRTPSAAARARHHRPQRAQTDGIEQQDGETQEAISE